MTLEGESRKGLSNTQVAVISGVIVWPLWIGLVGGVAIFIEEGLGYNDRYEGPDWIPQAVVIAMMGVGFFLWKVVGSFMAARWGKPEEIHEGAEKEDGE